MRGTALLGEDLNPAAGRDPIFGGNVRTERTFWKLSLFVGTGVLAGYGLCQNSSKTDAGMKKGLKFL